MTNSKYVRPGLNHALGKTVEEIGEVHKALGSLGQAIGKTLRWGLMSVNPELPPHLQETNVAWIEREIAASRLELADLSGAIDNLEVELHTWRSRQEKFVK